MNIKVIFLGLILALIGFSLFYYLPRTTKVLLVGTEVKRMDKNSAKNKTEDIRFIVARGLDEGETLMFRNQDMPWPPHFKFNSGDLAGKVMNWEEHRSDAVVLITYYGLRIPILSLYPNATSLKIVDKDYEHFPLFNILFFLILTPLCIYLFWKARNLLVKKL